ncbi:MAG: tRNA uridine-5-carboxymethylaminomethyl(34) synthesis GTPase MnmE [Hyphomicrobiaceae bacterium]|nr:tRNA uridine-5-carboxymethylaminomethyl(34) synthesis GTPase MnmE [Hyphomicrobiaceae bacterium]
MTVIATIFALSSGHGRAGVAVVRISGAAAGLALDRMAPPRPMPRRAAFRRICDPESGELLDAALVLFFAGPASETGEDIAELHLHGSPAVVRAVLAALARLPGYRLAEPGEFARRAFENGKIDLTAAEGLADLIDAETDGQRRQALAQAGGEFRRLCDGWRDRLLEARALAEAAIDFSDEADVATDAMARARIVASTIRGEIDARLEDAHRGEIVREGFRVVLAGAPNAGKSSLLNALARRDVAIVSPEAGTTRDVLEVHLDLGGYAVIVADTAGMREASDSIEREGVCRAVARARSADLLVWLVDAAAPVWAPPSSLLDEAVPVLGVLNKVDIVPDAASHAPADLAGLIAISATTGAGLPRLVACLTREVAARLEPSAGPAVATQHRHRVALSTCRDALARCLQPSDPELAAEDLRLAADALGRITGRINADEILGQIFGRFCIGK